MEETGYERRRKVRIKGNGAAVYVGSSLTVTVMILCFLLTNCGGINQCNVLLVDKIKIESLSFTYTPELLKIENEQTETAQIILVNNVKLLIYV